MTTFSIEKNYIKIIFIAKIVIIFVTLFLVQKYF